MGLMSATILAQGMAGFIMAAHTSLKSMDRNVRQVEADTISLHFSISILTCGQNGLLALRNQGQSRDICVLQECPRSPTVDTPLPHAHFFLMREKLETSNGELTFRH